MPKINIGGIAKGIGRLKGVRVGRVAGKKFGKVAGKKFGKIKGIGKPPVILRDAFGKFARGAGGFKNKASGAVKGAKGKVGANWADLSPDQKAAAKELGIFGGAFGAATAGRIAYEKKTGKNILGQKIKPLSKKDKKKQLAYASGLTAAAVTGGTIAVLTGRGGAARRAAVATAAKGAKGAAGKAASRAVTRGSRKSRVLAEKLGRAAKRLRVKTKLPSRRPIPVR